MFELATSLSMVRRQIMWRGRTIIICRQKLNEYKEATKEFEDFQFKGLFFIDSSGHKSLINADGSTLPSKSVPYVLALFEDCSHIEPENLILINDKRYAVTGIENVQEQNLIGLISLEELYENRFKRS